MHAAQYICTDGFFLTIQAGTACGIAMDAVIPGLHHVTAIAGAPQENLNFYAGVLGLRLVKKTVNFDDPGTYHFYYGDERGQPGTLLTFFPWRQARHGRAGPGMVAATSFAVPASSMDYWTERFKENMWAQPAALDLETEGPQLRFGEQVLQFTDHDSLAIELVAYEDEVESGWSGGSVPAEHAIRGFHSVTLCTQDFERTAQLLTETFGYDEAGEEDGRMRFTSPEGERANVIDLYCEPERRRGRMGKGTVHHVAFRASSEDEQLRWREEIAELGFNVTPVKDRQYFKSIYFREPGGVLFEIATDGPGFLTDETDETLGTDLKLPEWLEPRRTEIKRKLPTVDMPSEDDYA